MKDRISDRNAPLANRVSIFEPRLALSVGVTADVLVDLFASSSSNADTTFDPFAESTTVRQQTGLDGSGQTVAVIDSGIAWDHVAFANGPAQSAPSGSLMGQGNRVVGGWDFAENDAIPYDDGPSGYHGTHVAATIAGDTNSMQGVAPGADLVALRVFDDTGNSNLDWIESALRWVLDHRTAFASPITTVNLSLGSLPIDATQSLTQLDDEIRSLHDQGILVFAAAGNQFNSATPEQLAYPASHPLVNAVTSVDATGHLQDFAQRSNHILAAVGASVRSAVPDHVYGVDGKVDDYATLSGTSMATAELTGDSMLVRQALMRSGIDNPTPDQILQVLRDTATAHSDPQTGIQYEVVNLQAAIQQALSPTHPAPASGANYQWDNDLGLTIQGTSDSDNILVDLSQPTPHITVNDEIIPIPQIPKQLTIDAGDGNDRLEIIGSSHDENLVARSVSLANDVAKPITLQRVGFSSGFAGFENLVFRGGGGNDRATFFDSPSDDTLESNSDRVTLSGVGFSFVALDVNSVYAHGTAGGNDVAYLYDSRRDDHLAIRHQFTSIRNDIQFRLAYGFEKVFAFAGSGGQDDAKLYDSPGDDRFSASSNAAWISGREYYAGATGFANVTAESTAGGNDYATFYSTNPDDSWLRSTQFVQWELPSGVQRSVQGFGRIDTFLNMQPISASPASVKSLIHELERSAATSFFDQYGTEADSPKIF